MKIIKTQKNKGLEPSILGGGVIGYNEEIHGEDAFEFTYKLPLGAIKRLIKSYYENIKSIDSSGTYMGSSGSYEIRMHPYCYRMIADIKKQLDKHGLNGTKIDDEVFDLYFKADYEKMKRYSKNHGNNVMYDFKRCDDPECCEPLTRREKISYLLRIVYFLPRRLIWDLKLLMINFKDYISRIKNQE